MSAGDKNKLDGIEDGAQVNPQAGNATPKPSAQSPNPGTSINYSREDHVHIVDSSYVDAISSLQNEFATMKAQVAEMQRCLRKVLLHLGKQLPNLLLEL
jgi:hypothetical protein